VNTAVVGVVTQHWGGVVCDRTKNICEADYTHTWAKSILMKSRDQVTFSPTSCRQTNDNRFGSGVCIICFTDVFSAVTQHSSPVLRDDTKNSCVKQTSVCTELFSCMCMAVGKEKLVFNPDKWNQALFCIHSRELYSCYYLLVYFLPCHQVKLLESLESMDKDSFNMKFGGVLTYTTVGADLCIFYKENTDLDSDIRLRHTDWLANWLTDWPTNQPNDQFGLTDWLTDWQTDWLNYWLTNCLTDRQTDWLTNGLSDWISSEQTACLIDWWSDKLTE